MPRDTWGQELIFSVLPLLLSALLCSALRTGMYSHHSKIHDVSRQPRKKNEKSDSEKKKRVRRGVRTVRYTTTDTTGYADIILLPLCAVRAFSCAPGAKEEDVSTSEDPLPVVVCRGRLQTHRRRPQSSREICRSHGTSCLVRLSLR